MYMLAAALYTATFDHLMSIWPMSMNNGNEGYEATLRICTVRGTLLFTVYYVGRAVKHL